jgi:transposase InsO family protein
VLETIVLEVRLTEAAVNSRRRLLDRRGLAFRVIFRRAFSTADYPAWRVCSMNRSGNVWDNAAMESFFWSLKIAKLPPWRNRARFASTAKHSRGRSVSMRRAGEFT